MGVDRTTAVVSGLSDDYKVQDLWKDILDSISKISGKQYEGNEKAFRIIADHLKAVTFLLSEGIIPSNTDRGYVLRRLIRRIIRYGWILEIQSSLTTNMIGKGHLSKADIEQFQW